MIIDSKKIISITEVSQNFSKAANLVEKEGEAFIFKNNRPKYKLVDLDSCDDIEMTDDEKMEFVARRILQRHRRVFEELAK